MIFELAHYLEEDVIPDIAQFDILDFWKEDIKYPTLKMTASDVLPILVSNVAFKKPFCMGEQVVSPHRSWLDAQIIEALMCLWNWMVEGMKGNVHFFVAYI